MSNRRTTDQQISEYFLRLAHAWGGLSVNLEGGIGSNNPYIQRLIKRGEAKLERLRYGKMYSGGDRYYTVLRPLTKQANHPPECPGCGVHFRFHGKYVLKRRHHLNCPVYVVLGTDYRRDPLGLHSLHQEQMRHYRNGKLEINNQTRSTP